ncbi:Putative membrane protein OS=Rhodopirellula sallentina SM41 GN=RSSM_00981 PE=4 SV=1 [Gemmataceae bacterium]|nr:Putative membrane protein OS=Rhodopirellula sallentina SM41 GN=RSSM_00981 PE=4 SV=1 [Gemmataceae bacterium]VTU02358.1 Putative membrane protein OS=Rhodopirellula sallentina SM41 GN=RSSM_00981 PE=4 SV=1 [Gemmataceae bacterium]
MTTPAVDRVVRSARRRLAAQRFVDALVAGAVVALAVGVAWALVEPGRWWVAAPLLGIAALVAAVATARRYPTRTAAALELDARFGLHERVTAAAEVGPGSSDVSRAVLADAETHAAGIRVADKFPLRLPRSARHAAALAGVLAVLAFVWHPVTDTRLFNENGTKPADLAKKTNDPVVPPMPLAQPKPPAPTPDKPSSEKVAAIRAELDRLEREAKAKQAATPQWAADVTAAEDAARAAERESLDRLARMESQLKQLDAPAAKAEEFKQPGVRDTAHALAKGDLAKAEQALNELAKRAAANPGDPELRKELEKLRDAVRKAGENAATREKLEQLIEQAKKEGRDASGLEQELERAKAERSQPLKDLAEKLDGAANQLEKGDGTEAAKQLEGAAERVGEIGQEAQAAGEAQAQAERAGKLRTDAQTPGGDAGQAAGQRPDGKGGDTAQRDVRVRVPFTDPKGQKTPAGSGDFGNAFTTTDPAKLAPAIRDAARSAPAAVAGQPLTPADRAAVREFFERLGR